MQFGDANKTCETHNGTFARPETVAHMELLKSVNSWQQSVWIALRKSPRFITIKPTESCSVPFAAHEKWQRLAWTDGSDTTVNFPDNIQFWSYSCQRDCYVIRKYGITSNGYIDDYPCTANELALCESK